MFGRMIRKYNQLTAGSVSGDTVICNRKIEECASSANRIDLQDEICSGMSLEIRGEPIREVLYGCHDKENTLVR